MNEKVKMVIVMRNDLNMRKGKMVAQGGHAVLAAAQAADLDMNPDMEKIMDEWYATGCTKICTYVDSLEELLEIEKKGIQADLNPQMITDWGLTEFNGKDTITCLAFPPLPSSLIDPITGGLPLL